MLKKYKASTWLSILQFQNSAGCCFATYAVTWRPLSWYGKVKFIMFCDVANFLSKMLHQLLLPLDPTAEEKIAAIKLLLALDAFKCKYTLSTDTSLVPVAPALLTASGDYFFNANSAVRFLADLKSEDALLTNWLAWEETRPSDASAFARWSTINDSKMLSVIEVILFAFLFVHPEVAKTNASAEKWVKEYAGRSSVQSVLNIIEKNCSAAAHAKVNPKVAYHRPEGTVLPQSGKQNRLITSALPYVNNVPHLGNIIGCVLSADVYARYCRLRGYNTLYICGTDEYGTATETKALEEGITCQELCDKYHKLHAQVYEWFEIDFDYFGRTTTPVHTKIAQDIFMNLHGKQLLSPDSMEQLYCTTCTRFLADRYVEGVCPLCLYPDARGDQCDGCGKLLNATDLMEPRCKVCKTAPVQKTSTHMFLDLTKLQPRCEAFVNRASDEGHWTANSKTITNSWLKEGLKPRCITRDLKWGTPVPLDEMKEKVLYVWFDAPIGYLSITANYTSEWKKWWKNPSDVKLFQFMGKDNVPFHTVIFPCTLLGTEEPWTMLHHLSTTEYLNYEGDKFSKSRGIGVFGNNVMDSGIPVSILRYTLLQSRPETSDSTFSWNELGMRTNNELLANLGNFVNRTLKFLKAKFNGLIPEAMLAEQDSKFIAEVDDLLRQYNASMEDTKIRAALATVMTISSRCNLFLQESKLDNSLLVKEPKRCATIMALMTNMIYLLSALIYPFMPGTTAEMCKQLNAPLRTIPDEFSMDLFAGHLVGHPDHLFRRIDEKVLKDLFMKYGGEKILQRQAEAAALRVAKSAKPQ